MIDKNSKHIMLNFSGAKYYYFNGKLHREDGPAVIWEDCGGEWYLNGKWRKTIYYNKEGKPHREDGPAAEYADGTKYWYLNGKLHREDGPAIEYAGGPKRWYLNGKRYSESSFIEEIFIKLSREKQLLIIFNGFKWID